MNSFLATADYGTHLKIVFVAVLASMFVVWVGIANRLAADRGESSNLHPERRIVLQPAAPPMKPRVSARADAA